MTKLTNKKGFTIIEVVLVLAIAGLIFLMVFIALPNLQRTQKDTQRRNDVDRIHASVVQYIANNNKLPSNTQTFIDDYLKDNDGNFKGPDGGNYTLTIRATTASSGQTTDQTLKGKTPSEIFIFTGGSCGTDGAVNKENGSLNFAVGMKLEGNGYYCVDN